MMQLEIELMKREISLWVTHIWVGTGSLILKGAIITDSYVVGVHSVEKGDLAVPNSVYAGIPAVLKKKDVFWERHFRDVLDK